MEDDRKLKHLLDRIIFDEGILIVRDNDVSDQSEIAIVTGSYENMIRQLANEGPSFITISTDDTAIEVNSKSREALELKDIGLSAERSDPGAMLSSLVHDIGEIKKPSKRGGGFDFRAVNDRWNRRKRK